MTDFADMALGLAYRLADQAARTTDGVCWHGPSIVGSENDWYIEDGETGADLYSGSAGIGLFLGHAARYGADREPLAVGARKAIAHALAQGPGLIDSGRLGLYDGATGIAAAAVTVGDQLGEPDLAIAGDRLGLTIAARITDSALVAAGGAEAYSGGNGHDLISGAAGIALGLLSLYRDRGHPELLEAAKAAAHTLSAAATRQPWGSSWGQGEQPGHLTGLAHGAAGITLALHTVGSLTGDSVLLDAAAEGMRYERSWYSAQRRNWPDLRGATGQDPPYPVLWCHGALGIGVARLRVYQQSIARQTQNDAVLAEISAAVQTARDHVVQAGTALRHGTATDSSLCHGLAGAGELFLTAGQVLESNDHMRAAKSVGRLLIEQYETTGSWPCGVREAGEAPDLFLGLAGIGLFLLRLSNPAIPSPATSPSNLTL